MGKKKKSWIYFSEPLPYLLKASIWGGAEKFTTQSTLANKYFIDQISENWFGEMGQTNFSSSGSELAKDSRQFEDGESASDSNGCSRVANIC